MTKRAQIIPPRADLRRKAVNRTKGFDFRLPPKMVKKLEQAVHRSRDDFTADIAKRLTAMRAALKTLGEPTDQDDVLIALRRIYDDSREIKAAGGTIGYDLLTAIGKSLNDFVAGRDVLDPDQRRVVGLHIDALYVVLANRITGEGGVIEAAVVAAFAELTEKFSGDTGG